MSDQRVDRDDSDDRASDDRLEDSQFEDLDCSGVLADVWVMLDNECDEASRARVQRHLDSCGSCLAQYGLEEKIKSLVGRKCGGDRAPDGLRERLKIEIRRSVTVIETEHTTG
ncbi:mycothiol system anti-sigma-R factor [Rhodococcoides corynebacterioides]|uniref:Mycothiol system anti-sigma-R factor n=1 Tax=Rhodococcoides corynebacterioides TaxID=53972 RepID=A0ABS7P0J2_9NOCA|nr:mycothiol system anti-sigma-R factor [Rhodococcus corynebacterioides]MBY6365923.1 mycothiol system anti-sigma-R factor [Rhodococcus corynebacterioides]MBY6408566.1 mycothiol system anti-sigma-R factor [Rhodococcus corynebacterioides]